MTGLFPTTTPRLEDTRRISDSGMSLQIRLNSKNQHPQVQDVEDQDFVSNFSDLSSHFLNLALNLR